MLKSGLSFTAGFAATAALALIACWAQPTRISYLIDGCDIRISNGSYGTISNFKTTSVCIADSPNVSHVSLSNLQEASAGN